MKEAETYRCSVCDQTHDGPPLGYGFVEPIAYTQMPKWRRWWGTLLTTDTCRIHEKHFFILGNIRIPIIGTELSFAWTAWVSLSKENFQRSLDLWETAGRESEKSYFGWLSNTIPGYPETVNLKTEVYTQPVGERPEIILEASEHPLAIEQKNGITWDRVHEIASVVWHYNANN